MSHERGSWHGSRGVALLVLAVGCASGETGLGDEGSAAPTAQEDVFPDPPATVTTDDGDGIGRDELSIAEGCAGVFNPDQLLDLHLEIDPVDWDALRADATYSLFVPASFRCGDEPPITVGVRRKRSGGSWKVGLKVDFNELVPGQEWYGLRKLSLENGVSEGDTEDGVEAKAYLSEYLAWRIVEQADLVAGRAAFAQLWLNGEILGVYVNVEQVDKEFLDHHLGDDSGWLYKKSGGVGDGFKTHETDGLDDPYDDWFCFWGSGNTCPIPAADVLLAELPVRLDIPQLLTFGALNAYMGNTDGLIFKDNNYYWYDWDGGGRVYIPWDLDTTMKDFTDVYTGSGGGGGGAPGATSAYDEVLFSHWLADYEAILGDLVQSRAPAPVVQAEIDRALLVAGPALDADPYVSGTTADAAAELSAWWAGRDADVRSQLGL